jgi:hypothetical protein
MVISHPFGGGEIEGITVSLTVHGDGDALGQDEAVSAHEGGHLAEFVDL